MAELKTKPTAASVETFLDRIADEIRREDCRTLVKIMKQATKAEPKIWGPGIVGFGDYHYKGASGREGGWFVVGFANRKQALTLYLSGGSDARRALLPKLGKFKTEGGCLYIKRLADVDMSVLKAIVASSVKGTKAIVAEQKEKGDRYLFAAAERTGACP